MNKKSILVIFAVFALSANTATADDNIAPIIVDNGPTVSVPEPSTFGLMLAGIIGAGLVAYRNKKK